MQRCWPAHDACHGQAMLHRLMESMQGAAECRQGTFVRLPSGDFICQKAVSHRSPRQLTH